MSKAHALTNEICGTLESNLFKLYNHIHVFTYNTTTEQNLQACITTFNTQQ